MEKKKSPASEPASQLWWSTQLITTESCLVDAKMVECLKSAFHGNVIQLTMVWIRNRTFSVMHFLLTYGKLVGTKRQSGIFHCSLPTWMRDSAQRGFCVPPSWWACASRILPPLLLKLSPLRGKKPHSNKVPCYYLLLMSYEQKIKL